jgi:MFS family permease
LPRAVVALGLASLAMDVSSEIVHALLPLFMTTTLGASVAVVGLMVLFAGDMRAAFWVAAAPAFAAALIVLVGVRDPGKGAARGLAATPLALVVMNLVYALGPYPAGALADRTAPRLILLAGLASLIAADLTLAFSSTPIGDFAGVALWGAHVALTHGLFAKLIAEAAPRDLVGTAFGVFNFAAGLAALAASVIAGVLWSLYGPSATFLASGALALAAAVLTRIYRSMK